jgi:hypothetical protein
VRYGIRTPTIRSGGRLAADRVLRFGINGLSLTTLLFVLRRLLFLAPVSVVACG